MSSVSSEAKTVNTSDTLVAGAKNRSYVGIQNLDATNAVHISFGTAPATALSGIRVNAGEFLELHIKDNNSEIRGIAITGNVNIVLLSANNG